MKAKQYLRRIKWLDNIIQAKLDQVDILRATVTKVIPTLRPDVIQEPSQDKTIVICKIVDLENDINKTIDELIDLKQEAIRKIDSLEDDGYKFLLTARYLNFKTWEQIAVDMNFTYQWVHQIHRRALIDFQKKHLTDDIIRNERGGI